MDSPPLQHSSSESSRSTTPTDFIIERELTLFIFIGVLLNQFNSFILSVSSNKIR